MSHARGFTLVELMVTIGVAAIVLGLAVPSFVTTIRESHMTSAANDLLMSLQLARSESIKRHVPISVCRSATANADEPACGGGSGWEDGWVVFVDATEAAPNPNGSLDAGEELLQTGAGFRGSVRAQAAANSAPLADSVTFLGSGFPQGDVPGGRNLLLCDDRHSDSAGRVLNISQIGRSQVRRVDQVANLNIDCQE